MAQRQVKRKVRRPARRPAPRATPKATQRRGPVHIRLRVGFILVAMVLSVFGGRLVQLQGIDPHSYAAMAAAENVVDVVLPAERGEILDRDGEALADSSDGLMVLADPRVIEVLGWIAYLVPMLAMLLLPARLRPGTALARRLRIGGAVAAVAAAAALFVLVPLPSVDVPREAPLADGRTAVLAVAGDRATLTADGEKIELADPTDHTGNADTAWHAEGSGDLPATLTAQDLLTYTGNRVPVGLNLATAPGPYEARWTDTTRHTVLSRDEGLVDVRTTGKLLVTIEGGGLTSPRTFTVDGAALQVEETYATDLSATIADADHAAHDRLLWKHWVPVALIVLAGLLLWQSRRRPGRGTEPRAANDPGREGSQESSVEGTTHVA